MMEQLKTGVELIEVEEGHRMEEEADHRRSDEASETVGETSEKAQEEGDLWRG